MVIFTKKFGTLDPHLPLWAIVWDKVPKKRVFLTPSLIALNENTLYKLNTRIGLASKPRFLSKGRASQFRIQLFNSIPMVLLDNQVRGLYQVQPQQRLAKVAVINPKKTLQSKPFLIRSPADILMHFYGV